MKRKLTKKKKELLYSVGIQTITAIYMHCSVYFTKQEKQQLSTASATEITYATRRLACSVRKCIFTSEFAPVAPHMSGVSRWTTKHITASPRLYLLIQHSSFCLLNSGYRVQRYRDENNNHSIR